MFRHYLVTHHNSADEKEQLPVAIAVLILTSERAVVLEGRVKLFPATEHDCNSDNRRPYRLSNSVNAFQSFDPCSLCIPEYTEDGSYCQTNFGLEVRARALCTRIQT